MKRGPKLKGKEYPCHVCGKLVYRRPSAVKDRVFCTLKCCGEYARKYPSNSNNDIVSALSQQGMKQSEIARMLKISKQRVHQILNPLYRPTSRHSAGSGTEGERGGGNDMIENFLELVAKLSFNTTVERAEDCALMEQKIGAEICGKYNKFLSANTLRIKTDTEHYLVMMQGNEFRKLDLNLAPPMTMPYRMEPEPEEKPFLVMSRYYGWRF